MPATRRRFTWEYRPDGVEDPEALAFQVNRTLTEFCEDWPQWYSDPEVNGWQLGPIQFSITVVSRDQWWVGRRALRVLSAIRAFTDVEINMVTEVSVERLPPHEHRGKTWLAEHRSQ